jgi:integrase
MKYNLIIAPERRNDKTGQPIVLNVPIFAQISFSGNRIFYFTGYRLDAHKFDNEKQEVSKNSSGTEGAKKIQYNVINKRFKAIRAALELFFQSSETASKNEVKSLLDAICKKAKKEARPIVESSVPAVIEIVDFYGLFTKYKNEPNISEGRKKHINTVISHFKQYEASRGIVISFDTVNDTLLKDFENYLRTESTKPKSKKNDEIVLSPKGINTIHSILSITRSFWNFSQKALSKMGIEISYPFGINGHQVPGEKYAKPIYLSIAERDHLLSLSLPSIRLQHIRDIFVFQSLIGARVGDMCRMTKANIQNNILTYIPSKTAKKEPTPITVPLNKKALEILSKYDLPGGQLLPFITDQRYNEYLKDLFREAGLNRIVTRQNPTTGKEEQVKICDIASSHMARRCFVGNLYGKVDSGIIASMSGHAANSKAFARYYKVNEELQRAAINLL